MAHRARDAGLRLLGQVLRIPAVCHVDFYPPGMNLRSLDEHHNAPILSKASMEAFWGYYNPPDPTHRDASPLLADDFENLAPAYVQIAGMDPLRDEGIAYANQLKNSGYVFYPPRLPSLPQLRHSKLTKNWVAECQSLWIYIQVSLTDSDSSPSYLSLRSMPAT
jgi:acetyl esterase/lipase